MKKHFIITLLLTVLFSAAIFGQTKLLWVGDITRPEDKPVADYLKSNDYTITSITSAEFKTGNFDNASAYKKYDAVFFSELIGSSDVIDFKKAKFPIPCVTAEGHIAKTGKWDLVADNGTQFMDPDAGTVTDDIKTIVIQDTTHYITKIFTKNQEVVWTSVADKDNARSAGLKLEENIEGAVALGELKDSKMAGFHTLWAVPGGSTIKSIDTTITANMVVFITFSPAMEFATEEYKTIVKRALEWATGNEVADPEDPEDPEDPDAIENNTIQNTQVFPNPASGLVTVTFEGRATRVILSNLTGQKVAEYIPEGNIVTFETSNLSAGIYFVTVGNETLKLIVE